MNKTIFNIKPPKEIPYGDQVKSLSKSLKNGSKSRGENSFFYTFKRLKGYLLMITAYIMPFNAFRIKLNRWKGVNIGNNVYIGMFVFIDNAYPEYVYIEDNAAINAGSMIVAHFNLKQHFERLIIARVAPVVIKEGAMIAIRSVILPGVTIGEFSMVSALSVVSEDVEPYVLVRGNPATIIAKYNSKMINRDYL